MKLIVGLGNIGKEYENTRHNIGFMVLDSMVSDWSTDKLGSISKQRINNEQILFLKPNTFMNLSGEAVRHYANFYKIEIQDIFVIQDDMDIEIGKTKIKKKSSAGGHNGIKNIIANLGTDEFLRLKVGIGNAKYDTIDHVLGKFTSEEQKVLKDNMNKYQNAVNDFINGVDPQIMMNRYN